MTTILAASISFLGGLAASWYAHRLSKKKPTMTYSCWPTLVLNRPGLPEGFPIHVTARFEGHHLPLQEHISTAYVFAIKLSNRGPDDIEQPRLEFELDSSARILRVWTTPTSHSHYEIDTRIDAVVSTIDEKEIELPTNRTWTTFPFLNSGDTVLVNIASINNRSWKCDVKRASIGFELMSESEYQPATEILKRSAIFMLMLPVIIAVLFLSGLALFHLDFVQQAVGIITKAVSPTLARLGMDPGGSLGFISGMIWSLVIGWSSRQLLFRWNRRLQ